MSKFLIVGLGNIGSEYAGTRHNIGFDIADSFAEKHGGRFNPDRLADKCELRWKGKSVILIKPTTYMNLSGRSVKYWKDKESVDIKNMLVLLDDLALPLERLRVRPTGSDAGHNGLKSIQEALGTNEYPKLRFGIGSDFPKGGQSDYVLGRWTDAERPMVNFKKEKCIEIIETYLTAGIERTMNQYNKLVFIL